MKKMLRLDINLVFTLINLLILYIVIRKFLFAPVNKILAKRKELLDDSFREAEEAKEKAHSLKVEYEASISGVEAEKEQARASARKEAQAEYDRIVNNAQGKADKIVTEAKTNAQADRDKLLQKAQGEITGMVVDAAAKMMAQGSNADSDKKLYEQFLTEAGDSIE